MYLHFSRETYIVKFFLRSKYENLKICKLFINLFVFWEDVIFKYLWSLSWNLVQKCPLMLWVFQNFYMLNWLLMVSIIWTIKSFNNWYSKAIVKFKLNKDHLAESLKNKKASTFLNSDKTSYGSFIIHSIIHLFQLFPAGECLLLVQIQRAPMYTPRDSNSCKTLLNSILALIPLQNGAIGTVSPPHFFFGSPHRISLIPPRNMFHLSDILSLHSISLFEELRDLCKRLFFYLI